MRTVRIVEGCQGAGRRAGAAWTLVEMLMSLWIFSIILIGMLVYGQMFAWRTNQLVQSKLGASETMRRDFNTLTADIRSARQWYVGAGTASSFTACGNDATQQGNAVQIYPSSDTNCYIRYFFDNSAYTLSRMTAGASAATVIARNLTNLTAGSMLFTAQDQLGVTKTDLQMKYVISTTLEFSQYQYPVTPVGSNRFFNYYRIQLKATSHSYNGA
jgi:hypothetical protein